MRALVVSNMLADAAHPQRGRFVRDQVAELQRIEGIEVQLHELAPGPRALAAGARTLRKRYGKDSYDIVHAHFGLSAWPALAISAEIRALTVHGTDIAHPRTRLLTRAVIPRMDILAAVSAPLAAQMPRGLRMPQGLGLGKRSRSAPGASHEPGASHKPSGTTQDVQVLPCGVDLERFHPISRARARDELGLDPAKPFVLFAADSSRPEKRYDRALGLARAAGVELRTLGQVAPERVPYWVNASNAVLVTSEREGFGLVALEALACDVPVLATPVGIHPEALEDVAGALCAPFAPDSWQAALSPHLRDPDPRIAGRSHAEPFSARRMAERVVVAWRTALEQAG